MEKQNRWMSGTFVLLWQGQIVSQIGTQVFLVTLALWLKEATQSATLIGLLMMAGTVPAVVLGPLGGVLVDRYSRIKVLATADLVRGLMLLGLGILMSLRPESISLIVGWMFLTSIVGGTAVALWQPAAASLLPDLVPKERLARANSMIQASFQTCALVGLGVGGILFRVLGAPLLALFDAFSYIYAAFSEAIAKVPKAAPRPAQPTKGLVAAFKAEIVEGLRFIRDRAGMRMLFYTMAFLQFFLVPMTILLPFYVDEHLLVGPDWYGFLLAGSGLGAFFGFAAAAAVRTKGAATSWSIVGLLMLISLSLGSLGLVYSPWSALGILFGIGAMGSFMNVKLTTILQLATPVQVRGRVFGLLGTIVGGLAPVSMALTGFVADQVGRNFRLIYLVCGGVTAALSASIALRRECRTFLAGEEPTAPVVGLPGGVSEPAR